MSCAKGLGLKPGAFWAHPYWENVKPAKFFMYPCRGVLHTPRNVLRQGFAPKTGRVLGVSLFGMVKSGAFLGGHVCGNMKPAKFCVYPCRGVLHTPRNALRQGFGPKNRRVLGASLLEWVKSGAFLTYPDGGIWA